LSVAQAHAPAAGADPDGAAAATLRRLRWRARRGLLENDLVLTRFLDRHAAALAPGAVEALAALLELPDQELLDLVLERGQLQGPLDRAPVREVLALLRAA
jgi:antitoxin CptB